MEEAPYSPNNWVEVVAERATEGENAAAPVMVRSARRNFMLKEYETKEDDIFSLTEAEDTRTGNDNNAMLSRSVFPNTYYAYLHILLREMREMGDVSADIEPTKTRTATSLNERPFS